MRLRITFAKTEAMRYTGHLDLHRALERSFRRAGLPLAYTQGYSPRPRLNLASALPLGFTSEAEVLDAWLEQPLPVDQVRNYLDESNPPGISIRQIVEVDDRLPSLQSQLVAQDYVITLLEPLENLENKIRQVLEVEDILRVRRKKEYNLRPLIHELSVIPQKNQEITEILTRLSAVEGGTGRPEEVVAVLGGQTELARYHRTNLIFTSQLEEPLISKNIDI